MNPDNINNIISITPSIASMIAIFTFIWLMRKDSKEDFLRLETRLETWRKESKEDIKAIQEEMKDFHDRLIAIEERKKNKESKI